MYCRAQETVCHLNSNSTRCPTFKVGDERDGGCVPVALLCKQGEPNKKQGGSQASKQPVTDSSTYHRL